MSNVRKIRSNTGPANASLITQLSYSQTLPRGDTTTRRATIAQTKHSKDDLDVPKPYLIKGPMRRAPLPPEHRPRKGEEIKKMPRRRAPLPPTAVPSTTLQNDQTVGGTSYSSSEHSVDDLYDIPDKATSSLKKNAAANTKHRSSCELKKNSFFPPPIPTSPRPSYAKASLSQLSLHQISKTEEEETESIYEETNCQPSSVPPTATAAPIPPPLPPRSLSIALQPPDPPLSPPPPSKSPAPDPVAISVPPRPPKGTYTVKEEDEELYTEMSSIVRDSQQHQEEDNEYICMEEAINFRNRFIDKEKESNSEINNSVVSNPTTTPAARESQQSSSDHEDDRDYVKMGIHSGSYVKMIRNKLGTSNSVFTAPPIPPKPNCSLQTSYGGKQPRTVPKRINSVPHIPPPPPPPPHDCSSMMEDSECYEPVSCEPESDDNQMYEPVSITEELYL